MFGNIKKNWELSRIGASIEGVVREAARGDGTKVLQWYADYINYTNAYCRKNNLSSDTVFALALRFTPAANGPAFKSLIERIASPGQPLHELRKGLHY